MTDSDRGLIAAGVIGLTLLVALVVITTALSGQWDHDEEGFRILVGGVLR